MGNPWSENPFADRTDRRRGGELPFPNKLDDGGVSEDDVGFILQSVEVMFGECVAFFGRDEESACFLDERAGRGRGEGFFFIKGLVHGDNEFGEWMEPGEPWVPHEQFQKTVGRLDRADGLLVAHAVVVDKGLVEAHEGVTDFRKTGCIGGGGARVGRHSFSAAVLV